MSITDPTPIPKKRGLFSRISTVFADRKIKKENRDQFATIMYAAVADGKITDEELHIIDKFQREHEIPYDDFASIRDAAFNAVLTHYLEDRRVTKAESEALILMASRLGMSGEAIESVKEHISYFELLHTLESVPFERIPAARGSGINLQKNEIDYFTVPAELLEERVVRSQYVGGSRGVSIRLMKGVSYRVGQSRGHIESERAVVPVSSGNLTITNQRLVYVGDRKSVNTPFPKVMNIEMFSDGIRFSVTSRQKPVTVRFYTGRATELAGMYISRMLNQ